MSRKFNIDKYKYQYINNSDYNYEKGNRVIENPETDVINIKSRIELPTLNTTTPKGTEPPKPTYTRNQVMSSLMKSGNYDPNKDTGEFAETRKKNFLNNVEYYLNHQDEYRKKFLEEQTKPKDNFISNTVKKVGNTKFGKFTDRLGDELADAVTGYTGLEKYLDKKSTGSKFGDGAAEMIGKGLSLAVNPVGKGSSVNSGLSLLGKGAERVASKINVPVLNKIVPSAAKGAAEFAGLGAMESYGRGENVEDTLKNVGSNALSGAVFGGATKAIGEYGLPVIKKGANSLLDKVTKTSVYEEGIQSANGKFKPASKPVSEVAQTSTQVNTPKINIPKVNDEIMLNDNGIINGGIITKANKNGTFEVKIETNKGIEYRTVKPGKEDMFESVLSQPTHTMDIPLEQRTFDNVGSKKVKSYQYLHPELKTDIQSEANILKGELERTIRSEKGSNYVNGERIGFGNERVTSQDIATIKDVTGKSYNQINKAIDNIIKDNGAENNALSKKIELILDERLTKGYIDDFGNSIPPNKNYANIKNTIETQSPNYKMNLQLFPLKTPQVKPSGDLDSRRLINTVKGSEWANDVTKSNLKDMKYDVKHNQDVLNLAQDYVKNNRDDAISLIRSNATPTAESNTIALELVRQLQNEGNMEHAIDVVEQVTKKATSQGQAIQALSMWGRLTPEGMLKHTQREFNKANKLLPKTKMTKLTPEFAKHVTERMKEIGKMADGHEKNIEVAKVLRDIDEQIPSTIWRKISTVQSMAQLLNPKTINRNITGNMLFGQGLENAANTIGTPLDKAVSLITKKRTTTFPNPLKQFKDLYKGFKESASLEKQGISLEDATKFDLKKGRTFKRNTPLGKLETAMNIALKSTDAGAKKAVYNESLRQQMKLAGLKEPTDSMKEFADQLAKYRTFQDDNAISNGLVKIKNALNAGKEFGVGDLIIKYPKTPGNIIARGIDYSPLGLYNTLKSLPINGREFNQKQFVDSLSRVVTGAGVAGIGYGLSKLGIVTGVGDKNKNVDRYNKQRGYTPYSLNVDALMRFKNSGKEEDAKPQKGDRFVNWDWAAPASITFGMGANIGQKKNGIDKITSLSDSLVTGMNTIFEQPVLSGIKNVTQYGDLVGGMADTLYGIPASFTPTLGKQIAQTMDNTARNSYDPSVLKQSLNRSKSKLPVLTKNMEPQVTTFGEDKQNYTSTGAKKIYDIFANPAFVNTYNPINQEVEELYKKTGEKVHYPRISPKYIEDKEGTKHYLTAQENTEFQRKLAEETQKIYDKNLIKNDDKYVYKKRTSSVKKEDREKYRVVQNGKRDYTVYYTDYDRIVNAIQSDITEAQKGIKEDYLKLRGIK